MKYFGDNTYELDGFTTSVTVKTQDIESLCTANSSKINILIESFSKKIKLGGQPPLNPVDANYIFTQIAKVFCFMFHHEQNERSTNNESK